MDTETVGKKEADAIAALVRRGMSLTRAREVWDVLDEGERNRMVAASGAENEHTLVGQVLDAHADRLAGLKASSAATDETKEMEDVTRSREGAKPEGTVG